jgi:DNA-binding transcriptional regulator YiaG
MKSQQIDRYTIRICRKSLGLTQAQAGLLLGTGRRTWQDWEKGLYHMPIKKWELWCVLSGLTPPTITRPL